LRFVDRLLPPAPPVIARMQRLLDASGLPQVFAQLEPLAAPRLPLPVPSLVQSAFGHAAASTVRLESPACGGIEEGSGFVVAPGVIVTNAHVIAGARRTSITANGTTSTATPVLFDPNLDIAVLRDPSIQAPTLPLAATVVARGAQGAIVGYPHGGPLTARPGVVLAELQATGRNIYGSNTTSRAVYEIEGIIRPGNSGGPLIAPDGTVIGVVFARSTSYSDIGYALTSAEVRQRILPTTGLNTAVATGPCTGD
jgi:S1-C subfamily serine protease